MLQFHDGISVEIKNHIFVALVVHHIFMNDVPTAIAQFIWNAEISVSVAIHCYEHLF